MTKLSKCLLAAILLSGSSVTYAGEANGTGSMIAGPLIRVWAEKYGMHSGGAKIEYKGSNPADGIKSLLNKEADFSCIDMPMKVEGLKKNNLIQFPIALGGVAPVVNLPNVYPGQFKLDGQTLGDMLLGVIKKWNDPAIAALNPSIKLPDAEIILVHRVSPPGISTIIGDYLSKTHDKWGSIKGDGMAGTWPENSIEVKNPIENIEANKKTLYALGYAPIPHIMKGGLSYAQLKNKAGKFVSPSDENISDAALNADWNESNGFGVVLTNQGGTDTWPLSMAAYVLTSKTPQHADRSKELLAYFKYSLRHGGLKAVENDYIPLPDAVRKVVQASWKSVVDDKGVSIVSD